MALMSEDRLADLARSADIDSSQILGPTIHVRQLRPILDTVSARLDVDVMLHRHGLPEGLRQTAPDTAVPLNLYYRLQREIARALDDFTAQLSERKLMYKTGEYVLEQMKQAHTLKDALICLSDHFNMMHGDTYNSVEHRSKTVSLRIDDSSFPYTLNDDVEARCFVGDCLLIKLHSLLDSISQGQAEKALRRVGLKRQRGGPGASQNLFWGAPITYSSPVYELAYDADLACSPIQISEAVDLSSDGIFAVVIGYLDARNSERIHRSYRDRVRELVEGGDVSQDAVAAALGFSVATLRRRLTDEQTSFRDIVSEVRLSDAKALLQRGHSVSQVAESLDYSDIRAFNRAFKRWTGKTPAAFARSVRASSVS